ncbi:hypothetical protein F5Y11DRAFT_36267 [Daldinia sp. FL1419]|nr:hypothetical protein F5Y11DRAFT_36267 [Daldinia sp. FL1419]
MSSNLFSSPWYGDGRRTQTGALHQDKMSQFRDAIRNEKTMNNTFDYVKTRQDFIRRYPSLVGGPESMTSLIDDGSEGSQEDFLAGTAPIPPKRPTPASQSTRYGGSSSPSDSELGVSGIAMLGNAQRLKGRIEPGTGRNESAKRRILRMRRKEHFFSHRKQLRQRAEQALRDATEKRVQGGQVQVGPTREGPTREGPTREIEVENSPTREIEVESNPTREIQVKGSSGGGGEEEAQTGGQALAVVPGTLWKRRAQALTRLISSGSDCYSNSTLQVLLASPGFANDICNPDFPQNWRVPLIVGPTKPQLLCQILKHTFNYMQQRHEKLFSSALLLRYMRTVHRGYMTTDGFVRLGDRNQHDLDELFTWMDEHIGVETSSFSNPPQPYAQNTVSTVESVTNEYLQYVPHNFATSHFGYFTVKRYQCKVCNTLRPEGRVSQESRRQLYPMDISASQALPTLDQMLQKSFTDEGPFRPESDEIEDIVTRRRKTKPCVKEGCPGSLYRIVEKIVKSPRLLRAQISRTGYDRNTGRLLKSTQGVTFPLEIDLEPFVEEQELRDAIRESIAERIGTLPHADKFLEGYSGISTKYELYGIQVHLGNTATTGHYWAYIRGEEPDTWWKLEDSNRPVKYSGRVWRDRLQELYHCRGSRTPVYLFYKRKDIPWDWELSPPEGTQQNTE